MSYQVFTVKLDNAGEQSLIKNDRQITEFFILDMPVGASLQVKPGQNRDYITVTRPFTMEPTGDDGAGLTVNVPVAQPGVSIELVCVFGGAQLGTVLT